MFYIHSYIASLSNTTDTSVWCVVNNALYGSTTHVDIVGDGYTSNPSYIFTYKKDILFDKHVQNIWSKSRSIYISVSN